MFSPCLCGFSACAAASHNPKTCKVRLIGYSRRSVGVDGSVNGCLPLYISPVMNWRLLPNVSSSLPVTLKRISGFRQ